MQMVIDMEDTDHRLNQALQEYTKDKDFTGWATHRPAELARYIKDEMGDIDDYIGWWLWDCPERGKAENANSYTVEVNGKKFVLGTLDDLYDFLNLHLSEPSDFDKGVKFALRIIVELRETNSKTKLDKWQERDALLKYIHDKIENEWRLHG